MEERQPSEYQASDADAIIGEIFSREALIKCLLRMLRQALHVRNQNVTVCPEPVEGHNQCLPRGIIVAEAIERLRTRLLDLSSRNSLLNYRHPKGRSVQIANNPNLNLVFDRLMDSKAVPLKYVPEPDPASYEGKRPEAKLYATRLGISTSFEFSSNPEGANGHRLHGIQTLLYPADLERQLRKIASEAKTAIEETGSNMLFIVFGFLEFYDSDDSDRAMLAPLLSLPVVLAKGAPDRDTRTYQYSVLHSGEDLAENHTLREKMRRDFMLTLPEYGEDEVPESYFSRIAQAISKKRRWKVRRQITLGMLSFGKLAIWSDLDSKKNPELLQSELVKSVFSGGEGGGGLHAEDYRIDERPEAAQPLIFDADSSQHSAIIDVLSGKNIVVNGPPGTGKSQTITNIIAAALSKGKSVLFVSEKLAALEVVRHRLNHVGLGHFCLELHSHKTQKKKLLEDIQTRIEQHFPAPLQFQAKMATLQRQKAELARYAELMGSRIDNSLGLTINEVFWAAERRRQELGEVSAEVNAIDLKDASGWTHDDLESRRSRLSALAELYDAIGGRFDQSHPWWGFRPELLAPTDDEAIGRIVMAARESAVAAKASAIETVAYFGLKEQPDAASATRVVDVLGRISSPADMVEPSLLPKIFDVDKDPKGQRNTRLISDVVAGVEKARRLFRSATEVLSDGERSAPDGMDDARQMAKKRKLAKALLSSDIGAALDAVSRMEKAIDTFTSAAKVSGAPYGPAGKIAVDSFLANCRWAALSGLTPFPISQISAKAAAVLETGKTLRESLARIDSIASKRGLTFDGTPDAVARFADPAGIPGLSRDTDVSEGSLTEARRLAAFPLSDKPISELRRLEDLLNSETDAYTEALERCHSSAERMGISFDSTERSVAELAVMSKVCLSAPPDLLEYRRPKFGRARTAELIGEARAALDAERAGRDRFDRIFYLDALPPVMGIKASVAALRRKEGFFAYFDSEWREARRLHANLSREKRKLTPRDQAEELAALAAWIESKDAFVSNAEMRDCFGGLFRGLDTAPGQIETLNAWYLSSRAALAQCPGLVERFDLTAVSAERIAELSAKAATISSDAELLGEAEAVIRGILGGNVAGFHEAKVNGWDAYGKRKGKGNKGFREAKARRWDVTLEVLRHEVSSISNATGFFENKTDSDLSPGDVLRLMEARADLTSATSALDCLMRGQPLLRDAGGEELGWLANLAGGQWHAVLEDISSKASKTAETATQALAFAGADCPLSVAESFVRAKVELDAAWGAVATPPQWNRFVDWAGLASVGTEDAIAARMVLERIAPCAKVGRSAIEVFTATAEEAEARSILERFASSDDVRRVLGNFFNGAETNLDRLSATYGWGIAVCSAELPTAVSRRLLAPDAAEALATSKRLYAGMADGCAEAKESVKSLAQYGSFSWNEWQHQVRGSASTDLPSEILSRLELVAKDSGSVLPWSKYLSLRMQAEQEGARRFRVGTRIWEDTLGRPVLGVRTFRLPVDRTIHLPVVSRTVPFQWNRP